MIEEIAKNQSKVPATLKGMLSDESIKNRFNELLGNKSAGFISSIINVAQTIDEKFAAFKNWAKKLIETI
jgi:recombinational DNA repair protein RecT